MAAASDPIVGSLGAAGGMYRDEVHLSDLSPEAQCLLLAALEMYPGGLGSQLVLVAARQFKASMGVNK